MNRTLPVLSRGLLIVGGLLILAGLGWGLWGRLDAPPPPTIGDAGAVVLAVTAPSMGAATVAPTDAPTSPPAPTTSPTPVPAQSSSSGTGLSAGEDPTPDLLPDWAVTPDRPEVTPTPSPRPSTPVPPTPSPASPEGDLRPTAIPMPQAESPPTRIVAPDIDMDVQVVPMGWEMVDRQGRMVSQWVVPKKAAGWHMNSALPGQGENVVLSGHHNIAGKVFRKVIDLEPGDEITVNADGRLYEYVVMEKYILKEAGMPLKVRRTNAQWIMPTGDERLTLVTCWPYEWPGNTHRVVVVARPAEYFQQSVENSQ
ncbi:sortase [Chloroflexota bacterium]